MSVKVLTNPGDRYVDFRPSDSSSEKGEEINIIDVLFYTQTIHYFWLVGCIEDLRLFYGISAISRLGSRR